MRHGPSVWIRTEKLAASLQAGALKQDLAGLDVALQETVARVAAEMEVDPQELLAEAQAILERARAIGARTDAQITAFALRERGMTEEELQAEVTRLTERTGSPRA